MFEISWDEMLLIGAAALIFIGPKELPATLRALGQMTGKVRRMAGEFRSQFDEAMREADVQSIRKEFESMNDAASSTSSSFNPIQTIRDEIKGAVDKPAAAAATGVAAGEIAGAVSDPPAAEPALPPPEAPPAVDVASFDVRPETPAPVTASAPQPADGAPAYDVSPPRAEPQKDTA
ncbi:MAG: twin-arginine translocase subunit TatB [Rhizobiales bacterium]|nr:twin-arginine translocase subunit TatB [Hyphomicrobiales bacterium]